MFDRATYGDSVDQRNAVFLLVGYFNVTQVPFGPAHDESDQLTVVGADTEHGLFKLCGKVIARRNDGLNCNVYVYFRVRVKRIMY